MDIHIVCINESVLSTYISLKMIYEETYIFISLDGNYTSKKLGPFNIIYDNKLDDIENGIILMFNKSIQNICDIKIYRDFSLDQYEECVGLHIQNDIIRFDIKDLNIGN